jgi:hypothetical protein
MTSLPCRTADLLRAPKPETAARRRASLYTEAPRTTRAGFRARSVICLTLRQNRGACLNVQSAHNRAQEACIGPWCDPPAELELYTPVPHLAGMRAL